MMEAKNESTIIKFLIAIIVLLVIIIFLLLGWRISKLHFWGVELEPPVTFTPKAISTSPSIATAIQNQASPGNQPTSPNTTQAPQPLCQIELLGEWLYQQPRAPMPPPAGSNQVIFAHGDIDNSGTCHVKEFRPGEPVQGLGLGSFKLWLITGSLECIRDYETQLQRGAASHAGTDCPYLP